MKKLSVICFWFSLILFSAINVATQKVVHLGIGVYTAFALQWLITSVMEGRTFEKLQLTARKFIVLGALFVVLLIGGLTTLMNIQIGLGLVTGSILGGLVIIFAEFIFFHLSNSTQTTGKKIYQGLENLAEVQAEMTGATNTTGTSTPKKVEVSKEEEKRVFQLSAGEKEHASSSS